MENEYEVQRSLGRIEGGITEVKNEIRLIREDHAQLRSEFQSLEAGRLTKLESEFATTQAVTHAKAKNTAIIYSSVTGIIASIITALALSFLDLK